MHHRKIFTRYLIELALAHVLFFATCFTAFPLESYMSSGLAQKLVLSSPAIPALLMIVAVVRFYRGADEYQRQKMLENWSITAAITFLWTFIYGLFENAGLPHFNLVWICPAMAAASVAVLLIRSWIVRRIA